VQRPARSAEKHCADPEARRHGGVVEAREADPTAAKRDVRAPGRFPLHHHRADAAPRFRIDDAAAAPERVARGVIERGGEDDAVGIAKPIVNASVDWGDGAAGWNEPSG
jgi:hypothetical protein